jgi:hypothetical protein
MGGGFDETGEIAICDGDDVIKELNDAFGDPTSAKFQFAQSHNDFGLVQNVAGNYTALIAAYNKAQVPVSARWAAYLRLLGTVQPQGPQNIFDIAQFRNNGLIDGAMMETVVHVPKHGGHVHTRRGSKAGLSSQVDSPCPMPSPKP